MTKVVVTVEGATIATANTAMLAVVAVQNAVIGVVVNAAQRVTAAKKHSAMGVVVCVMAVETPCVRHV
ncbi:MAG: hypothetical protein DRJ03_19505 [Chloroflexi bacterium]|nr:MAG: hypothetical protein DRJ03_19505 [Chloroflexota bacterium]